MSNEEFSAKMAIKLEDITMQQAVVQFGVKERGFLTRWANAVKAAESLAFIKLNPTNTVRNVVNNTMTLIARGGFGSMTSQAIADFWKAEGYIPPRFIQAFNLGLDELGQAGKAGEILSSALNPKVAGAPEKIKDFFNKFEGLSKVSSKAEESASLRASTVGYFEAVENYAYTAAKNSLSPEMFARLERDHPDVARLLDNAAKDSMGNSEKFKKFLGQELEYSPSGIMDDASKLLGNKVRENLDTETVMRLKTGLPDAIREGRVPQFMAQIKADMEAHLDDLFEKNMADLAENVAQQVEVGGPKLFYKHIGNAIDEVRGAHTEDAIRMSRFDDVIKGARESGDYELAASLWEKLRGDRKKYYDRVWSKFDTYLKGMEQGSKKAKIPMPPEVRSAFKEVKKGWNDFFQFKEKEWSAVFDAIKNKKPAKSYDEVQDAITKKFDEMVEVEDFANSKVDDMLAASMPPEQARIFTQYRDLVAEMYRADKQFTSDFWVAYRNASGDEKRLLMADYWKGRIQRLAEIRDVNKMGSAAAFEGNQKGLQDISRFAEQYGQRIKTPPKRMAPDVRDAAKTYGVSTPDEMRNVVNKFLRGEYSDTPVENAKQLSNAGEITGEVAKEALRARLLAGKGNIPKGMTMADYIKVLDTAPSPKKFTEHYFMPDVERVIKDLDPMESKIQQFTYGRQYAALDAIEEAAGAAKPKRTFLKDLPADIRKEVGKWADTVTREQGDARYFGTRMGEFKRDSALLNYNRRTNFDAWAGTMFPFGFWTTHSAINWAVHSLDRPAMLSTYLRMRNFLDTAGLEDENAPSRLRRNIKINLPFTPDWMGSQFVDPLKLAFPFDAWMAPWERKQDMSMKTEGRAQRVLDAMLQSGEISDEEYQMAQEQQGPAWEKALQRVQEEDPNMKFDAFDFGSMLMSPHAPLAWAYNAAKGTPQDIGPFTPMSRTFRDVFTVLGVKDWNNSPMNLEGRVRKSLGLPAFDKWDDYRTDRMLSNMAGEIAMGKGDYTLDEIQRAMVERSGPVYEAAVERANQEFTGGPAGAFFRLLGLPVKSYPEGEEQQRSLQDDFARAYDAYNQAAQNADEG
ncbi:MAG TPA: hypothetical protein VJ742_03825, partial [Nitrososphaera sp.]|nr:hypothetical protein [Nitrososphaera sp.]